MSDGNVSNSADQQRVMSPGRVLGARSASPAKRTAADMEGSGRSSVDCQIMPGSFVSEQEDETAHFDEVMNELSPHDGMSTTQEVLSNGVDTSASTSVTAKTSATSFESDAPPPYSEDKMVNTPQQTLTNPSIDGQVREVMEICQTPLDEGERGYIVSSKWLARVISRSSDGLNDSKFSKDARQGPIGQLDNSDIVPTNAYDNPLKDMEGQPFIPLKPGLTLGEDFEVFPYKAWGLIVGWYGNTIGQKPIVRYARNTAPPDAAASNIIYELYPPVITVRKVQQLGQEVERPPTPSHLAVAQLRLKEERRARGQLSPEDAIQYVSSRAEKFNAFLKRSKNAAGIPLEHKVKIWKLLDASEIMVDHAANGQDGMLSPPQSRSASPKRAQTSQTKLVIDADTFAKMELGKDLEHIDAKDETNNSSYNGSATMEIYQLFESSTIALEEMIAGPGGGEYASDSKKLSARFGLAKKNIGSKPGSTTASGRTSPAPGGGMMTRGRQRRDGRTRGTVGLTNLGNTCYMNSALQCIRSVEELAVYFLSGKYKQDINANNPLGHHGAMANRYAEILKAIYTDTATGAVTPSAFKKTLGSIQPMFSGYGQQDSQEFLSFLVDALHEDLNRIQKKPYNENPDSDDKTVHDPQAIIKLGEIYRANHKARNDSVAMDLFSGFYKNTMECPECDKISITFDPYSLLTVQLPIESTFQHAITFVPLLGRPVNHMIDVDKNTTVKALKENIASKHRGVKADRLWMAEIYSHRVYKVFENSVSLGEAGIQTNDYLFVFELEDVPTNSPSPTEKRFSNTFYSSNREEKVPDMDDPKADRFAVPIFSRQKGRGGYGFDATLHPMYIVLTREEAQDFEVILKKTLIAVSRLTSRRILTEFEKSPTGTPATNAEMKDDGVGDDHAQISDTSVPSEDGYVEISIDKSEAPATKEQHVNGFTALTNEDDDRPIPKGFLEPQYFINSTLRHQLFALNYASSENNNLHCTGMSGIKDNSIRNMFDRVKQPTRRSSVQSSSSGEESNTSTGSTAPVNGDETEESDVDDVDKPDITLGEPEPFTSNPDLFHGESDEDEFLLPDNPLDLAPTPRSGRRRPNQRAKKGRKPKMYGKKGKPGNQANRPNSSGSTFSNHSRGAIGGRASRVDDDPYYIKLGEGIVLDWTQDAIDGLFNGDIDNSEDERGCFVSSADGRELPFLSDPVVEEKKNRREARKKNGVTLDDCFLETGKREVLSEDNAWYCNRCKELRRATKTLEIWTIPDILVVHLKRFGGNRSFRDKIDVMVDYPIEGLDMTERIGLKEDGKEYIYDLFAVDNHYGGLGGGHYTAMAKNFYDGAWYDYNDSSCSKIGENRLHSAAAYLLFYRRRSEKPLGPQYLQDLVLETRNPLLPPDATADDAADESDSGEGRLGGPNGSLLGSSSALKGAGVDPANLRGGAGGAGAAAATSVSSPLTTKRSLAEKAASTTNTSTHAHAIGVLHGEPIYGPKRPPHLIGYGAQAAPSWSFDALNTVPDTDVVTETLMANNDGIEDDSHEDDAASTTALMDVTGRSDDGDRMEEEVFEGFGDDPSSWSTAGRTTPYGSESGFSHAHFHDSHEMYSSAHENQDAELDSLRLGDDDMLDDPANDAPVAEIYPDSLPDLGHDKMD